MKEFRSSLIVAGLRHTVSSFSLSLLVGPTMASGKRRKPTEQQMFEERMKHNVRLVADIQMLVESFKDPELAERFEAKVKERKARLSANLDECCDKEAAAAEKRDKPYWMFDEQGLWEDRQTPTPPADAVLEGKQFSRLQGQEA